jgi:hypothetical protein
MQANNRRSSHRVAFNGIEATIAEWETLSGIPQGAIERRLNMLGWSVEMALTVPVGRTPAARGEAVGTAKLTEADVITILERSRHGDTRAAIARDLNVTIGAISRIVLGKNWKHLTANNGIKKSTRGVRRVDRVAAH